VSGAHPLGGVSACPFCHEPVGPGVCKGRLPGALGLVSFSPGRCGSTSETRAAKIELQNARAQAAERAKGYAREL
jgi:hypothetical protein